MGVRHESQSRRHGRVHCYGRRCARDSPLSGDWRLHLCRPSIDGARTRSASHNDWARTAPGSQDAPRRRHWYRSGVRDHPRGRRGVHGNGDVRLCWRQQPIRSVGCDPVNSETSLVGSFLPAVGCLTRAPVGNLPATADAIGRSTALFPLVGAGLGVVNVIVLAAVTRALPPTLTAAVIVLIAILATGALHFDGLADMADGFGGGRTREDVLRIKRRHQIGTYRAIAVIIALVIPSAAVATLVARHA